MLQWNHPAKSWMLLHPSTASSGTSVSFLVMAITSGQTLIFAGNVDSIDTDQLDALERHLEQAEQQLLNANIEQRYTELMSSRQQQSIWVRDYTDELIQLRKDVENIRIINETIPRQCFKEVELEPEAPSVG
jgi:hypothetical protein